MNDVTFVLGEGGLSRPLTGEDHISGAVVYNDTLPSGFSTLNRIKKFLSVTDAVSAGIDKDYSDETAATATVQITAIGANGDTINISIADIQGTTDLGTYTKVTGDSTATLVATAIKNLINAGTNTHGYSATSSTDTVTIISKKGQGIYLNSGSPITVTIVGTMTKTLVQFTGGVASKRAVYWYHISEFFRLNPNGVLYFGIFAVPGSYTFTDISTVQVFAEGKIRQMFVFVTGTAFAQAQVTAIQAVCTTLAGDHMPVSSVILGGDFTATADITTLADRSNDAAKNVSVPIAQDGAGFGNTLWKSTGKTVGAIGAILGAISFAAVNEDIEWIAKFNFDDGTELDTLAFVNGQAYTAISAAAQSQLDAYRYIFLRKFVGKTGSFVNDSHTCIVISSDYAYIENNRTIDKVIRQMYAAYLGPLGGPIQLKADGTLTDPSASGFRVIGEQVLQVMQANGEISAGAVTVNPAQNILTSSQLEVGVEIVPTGTARKIKITIGYTTSIS